VKFLCYTHIGEKLPTPVWVVVTKGNLVVGGEGYVVSDGFWLNPGQTFGFGADAQQDGNHRFLYDDTVDEVPDEAIAGYTRAILEGKLHDPRSTARAA
jgi:hypothetical protein